MRGPHNILRLIRTGATLERTGAMAVVMGTLVRERGIEYLFYAVIQCGVLQMLLWLLRASRLTRTISAP